MDHIFGRVTFKSRHSIADSIMMGILRSAMDRAHEKVRSKEGAIGRLSEISMFYELALMQLDGCQKFVQEEADSYLESSDEEVIGELAEIRDRLQWRLKASELAIEEKDRELAERLDNEVKLRRALEIKQRELDSLRKKLDLERQTSGGIEELTYSGDEETSDLMSSSVDQQVFSIKHKLDVDGNRVDKRMNTCADEMEIEGMRSDIDILKETMDIAFGRMQNAILLTGLEPAEGQLEQTIERDIVAILIKGFVADIKENVEGLQNMAIDQAHSTPFEGSVHKSHCDSCIYELEILLRERMLDECLKEMINEWNDRLERDKIMDQIGEEIFAVVISQAMKNHGAGFRLVTIEKEQWMATCNHLEDLVVEKRIAEGTLITLFREIYTQCNEIIIARNGTDSVADQEISPDDVQMVDAFEIFDHSQSEKSLAYVGYSIKDEVQMIFLKETCMDWKNIVDACSLESLVKHNSIEKLDLQLECKVIEHKPTCSERRSSQVDGGKVDLSGVEHLRVNRLDRSKELLGEMRGASVAVAVDISKTLEQLTNSKFLLSNLSTSFGIPVESETSSDKAEIISTRNNRMMPSTPFNHSTFTSLVEFARALEDFKSEAEERIGLQILRVEEVKDKFKFLSELVGTVKKKEILYKRAFISRCESLRKAEIEVDLLGDQVDALLGILEHTYLTLHQHTPVLQQFAQVSDILEMIDRELHRHSVCPNKV